MLHKYYRHHPSSTSQNIPSVPPTPRNRTLIKNLFTTPEKKPDFLEQGCNWRGALKFPWLSHETPSSPPSKRLPNSPKVALALSKKFHKLVLAASWLSGPPRFRQKTGWRLEIRKNLSSKTGGWLEGSPTTLWFWRFWGIHITPRLYSRKIHHPWRPKSLPQYACIG